VTAIRSMTRKADEARIRKEIAAATGPVTKCPPGKARGGTGKVKLLIRPRYTPQREPLKPRMHNMRGRRDPWQRAEPLALFSKLTP
jgi:hypothetical protein